MPASFQNSSKTEHFFQIEKSREHPKKKGQTLEHFFGKKKDKTLEHFADMWTAERQPSTPFLSTLSMEVAPRQVAQELVAALLTQYNGESPEFFAGVRFAFNELSKCEIHRMEKQRMIDNMLSTERD